MKDADIFVLPSSSEGFPFSMLEAMSYGIGVIITPVGDIPLVIKNGENGMFVPVGDQYALAKGIFTPVNDPALLQRLGRNAEKTTQNYSSFQKLIELSILFKTCLQKS